MRVVNNEKARAKTYIQNDMRSAITNILNESNEIKGLISQLSHTISGATSGVGNELIGVAQRSLSSLSQSIQYLQQAQQTAAGLDVTEEVPDDQY